MWIGLLVLVTLLWGNAFVAIKRVIAYVNPLELVTVRYVPVAVAFALVLIPTRRREVWRAVREDGWRLLLLGLAGGVLYNVFLGWGEMGVGAGTASLVIALNPAFTYVLSVLFLDETFSWRQALGLTIAFVGLFIVIRWGSGRAVTFGHVRYALITMLAPISWAVYTVAGKPLLARHRPLVVAGLSMSFAGVISLVFIRPSSLPRLAQLPAEIWGAILFLALACTVFAFVVWFGALQHLSAGRVASFVYLVPMFAVTFGHWLLDEPVTLALLAGAIVLVGGVWLVNQGG
jgi:drug/metabolite transporter (DMT)-like permease